MTKIKTCPICKTPDFEVTIYKEEGGYCKKCKSWVVPYSSRYGILNGNCDVSAPLMFHIKGVPKISWKDWRCGDMDD